MRSSLPMTARTTRRKLAIFRSCFSGLGHVYGTYDMQSWHARQVKRPVTDDVMLRHLQGRQPYGVYLLVNDKTRAVAVDFDREDTKPPLAFLECAQTHGLPAYLERSKRKGWHVWLFMESSGAEARKARQIVKWILAETGHPNIEVFPKQDELTERARFGNWIHAPLNGHFVRQGRTVFVDPQQGMRPFADQWALLESIERISETLLDELIEINGLHALAAESAVTGGIGKAAVDARTFGLAPCAQRMLAEGVIDNQRVACFRLALHLKKAGIPADIALAALSAWAQKNRPRDGKRIITPDEIAEQTTDAYAKSYQGCGCEEPAVVLFCDESCPLRQSHERPVDSHVSTSTPGPEAKR